MAKCTANEIIKPDLDSLLKICEKEDEDIHKIPKKTNRAKII